MGKPNCSHEETQDTYITEAIPINMQCAAKNGPTTPHGTGIGEPGDPAYTLGAGDRHAAMEAASLVAESGPITFPATLSATQRIKIEATEDLSGSLGTQPMGVCHSLRAEGHDASEDGTGRGTPLVPEVMAHGQGGSEIVKDGEPSLTCNHEAPILFKSEIENRNSQIRMAVRRLTPRECERLQGFPDDYTLIKFRKKPACDGPRYKSLGNSMARPVMLWLGQRIELVETLCPFFA